MSKLISGKEALIALANGEDVQGNIGFEWLDISVDQKLSIKSFITETNDYGVAVKFRLKPRTITINGIEVPCNKSKHDKDDVVWVISTACENWYDWIYGSDCDSNTLYWETEEEIKQVVEALRSVFKPQ